MTKTADIHSAWVDWLMKVTGKDISPLATDAGLAATTLNRKNKENGKPFHGYSPRIIDALVETYSVPHPVEWQKGVGADDAVPYTGDKAVLPLKGSVIERDGFEVWIVNTEAAKLAGYMPGDYLLIDTQKTIEDDDIVLATVFDRRIRSERTVLRQHRAAHLIARSVDCVDHHVLTKDNGSVDIKGVVVCSYRACAHQKNCST